MDCTQIRDAFVSGAPLSQEQMKEHVAGCPQCRELLEHDAELGRGLAAQAAEALPFPDDFFGQLEQKLAQETGPRAWLRSRSSGLRFVLLLLPLVFTLLVGGVFRHRADFEQYPLQRVGLLLCVYFAAILIAFGKELSQSARGGAFRDHWALLGFALGVPVLAAFAPATEASLRVYPGGVVGSFGCFLYGALLTAPIAVLLWAFDRNDRISLRTVCLSAAALGLSANLLLELHCGNGSAVHVLFGHASLAAAWLVVWAVTRRIGARTR